MCTSTRSATLSISPGRWVTTVTGRVAFTPPSTAAMHRRAPGGEQPYPCAASCRRENYSSMQNDRSRIVDEGLRFGTQGVRFRPWNSSPLFTYICDSDVDYSHIARKFSCQKRIVSVQWFRKLGFRTQGIRIRPWNSGAIFTSVCDSDVDCDLIAQKLSKQRMHGNHEAPLLMGSICDVCCEQEPFV